MKHTKTIFVLAFLMILGGAFVIIGEGTDDTDADSVSYSLGQKEVGTYYENAVTVPIDGAHGTSQYNLTNTSKTNCNASASVSGLGSDGFYVEYRYSPTSTGSFSFTITVREARISTLPTYIDHTVTFSGTGVAPTNTFYVYYDANGGSGAPSTQSYSSTSTSNHSFTIPRTIPTKSGYQFGGWLDESASKTYQPGGTVKVSPNSSVTLKAIWNATYTCYIIYNANGGSGAPSTQSYTSTSTNDVTFTVSSTIPTRSGYVFNYWYDANDGSLTYVGGDTITVAYNGTKTLMASWTPIDSGSWRNQTNQTITSESLYMGESKYVRYVTNQSIPSAFFEQVTVVSSSSAVSARVVNVDSNLVVVAIARNSSGSADIQVKFYTMISSPYISPVLPITESSTPTITYTSTLNYDANGGTGAPTSDTYTGTSTSNHTFTVSSTIPTRSGYVFNYWYDADDASLTYVGGDTITVAYNGTKTLMASWTQIDSGSWRNQNDQPIASESLYMGESKYVRYFTDKTIPSALHGQITAISSSSAVSATVATITGNEIVLQLTRNSSGNADIQVKFFTAPLTPYISPVLPITESLTPSEYTSTLNYDANGGTGAPPADTYTGTSTNSHTFTVSSTIPTRSGYVFNYWYDADDASLTYVGGDTISVAYNGTKTLMASWTPIDSGSWRNQTDQTITSESLYMDESKYVRYVTNQSIPASFFSMVSVSSSNSAVSARVVNVDSNLVVVQVTRNSSGDADIQVKFYTMISSPYISPVLPITESLTPSEYTSTLNYDANGGTGAPPADTYTGTSTNSHTFTVSSTIPTRSGYVFNYWYDADDASLTYVGGDTITVAYNGTKTLMASWIPIDSGSWRDQDRQPITSIDLYMGETKIVLYYSDEEHVITSSSFTVEVISSNNAVNARVASVESDRIALYITRVASGPMDLQIKYWVLSSLPSVRISPVLTINESLVPTITYTSTLNYDANGGTGAPSTDIYTGTTAVDHQFTVSSIIPTRSGYVFNYWYDADDASLTYVGGDTITVAYNGTKTLMASWTPIDSGSWRNQNDQPIASESLYIGESKYVRYVTDKLIPSSFHGQVTAISSSSAVSATVANVTGNEIVVQITRNSTGNADIQVKFFTTPLTQYISPALPITEGSVTCTLNYDANGGTGAPPSETYSGTETSDHTFTISSIIPTKKGCRFVSWLDESTSTAYMPGDTIDVPYNGTKTLIAIWADVIDLGNKVVGKAFGFTVEVPVDGHHSYSNYQLTDSTFTNCTVSGLHVPLTGGNEGYYVVVDSCTPTELGPFSIELTVSETRSPLITLTHYVILEGRAIENMGDVWWDNGYINGSAVVLFNYGEGKNVSSHQMKIPLVQYDGIDHTDVGGLNKFVSTDYYIQIDLSFPRTTMHVAVKNIYGQVVGGMETTIVFGTWPQFALLIDAQKSTITFQGISKVNNQDFSFLNYNVAYEREAFDWSSLFTTMAFKYIYHSDVEDTANHIRFQVMGTTTYLDTYGYVMIDPALNVYTKFPDYNDLRLNLYSFALFGDSVTINGHTYTMDGSTINIYVKHVKEPIIKLKEHTKRVGIDQEGNPIFETWYEEIIMGYNEKDIASDESDPDAVNLKLTLQNIYITWENINNATEDDPRYCYLTFVDDNITIDMGTFEQGDLNISMEGMWYFTTAMYEPYEGTEKTYEMDWWSPFNTDATVFMLMFIGGLLFGIVIFCLIGRWQLEFLDWAVVIGAGIITYILLGVF